VRTVLNINSDHWDEAPQLTEIIYTPIKSSATRVAALLSGEVDMIQDVPVQDLGRVAADRQPEGRHRTAEPYDLLRHERR
jgi:peptide/nickel transport system substrate-binding protein